MAFCCSRSIGGYSWQAIEARWVAMIFCGDIQNLWMVCMRAGSWTRQVKS